MNIIPQNGGVAQVGIPSETDKMQTSPQTNNSLMNGIPLSPLQEHAFDLYDHGLNVFPQPLGRKAGYPWRRLQYTRLPRDHAEFGLRQLFLGECNLAIMCGATSGNLFVIDCETEEALRHHARQMRQRNIPLWVVKTARGGHIYLRARDGEVHNVEPNIMRDAEIKGQRGYVLAPPSIHPSGAVYEWLVREGDQIPTVSSQEINWLRDQQGDSITLVVDPPPVRNRGKWTLNSKSPRSNLCYETQDYLDNGHRIPEGNRNNRLFKAACDLAGNGYDESLATSMLLPQALGSGLSERESHATICSAYSRPRNPSRPGETVTSSPEETWQYALLYATQHAWIGRTRNTKRAVFLALIERARLSRNETDVFRASTRELSELARMGINTIRRTLKKLKNMKLISSCGKDKNSGASLWSFTENVINIGKELALNKDTVTLAPHWLSYSESLFNSDVTERPALGHSVLYVYHKMRTLLEPMMPSALARVTGVTVNQVNYAIKKLRSFDLVERFPSGWLIVDKSMADLEAHMSDYVDVEGRGEAREERHQMERQVFVARMLFFVRAKLEGIAFRAHWQRLMGVPERFINWCVEQAAQQRADLQALIDDPLVQLGLELGGEIDLGYGRRLTRDMIQRE